MIDESLFHNEISSWLPEDDEDLRRMRAEGCTYREIADELGFTKRAVGHRARKLGLVVQQRPPWTADEVQRLREGLDRGLTRAECSAYVGTRSVSAVSTKLTALGWRSGLQTDISGKRTRMWTPEEDEKLRELAPHWNRLSLARQLGRSPQATSHRLRRLGLIDRRDGLNLRECGDELGCSPTFVWYVIKTKGIEVKRQRGAGKTMYLVQPEQLDAIAAAMGRA